MSSRQKDESADLQRKINQRNRKIKQRAPDQIKGMIASIKKIREVVDDNVIYDELTKLASVCKVNSNKIQEDSEYSNDNKYCYYQSYVWDVTKPYVLFICRNPQENRGKIPGQTIRKAIEFTKNKKIYGGVHIANLFSFVASDVNSLINANDPVSKDNDYWLVELANNAGIVIGAWGEKIVSQHDVNDDKKAFDVYFRSEHVRALIPKIHYLGVNKSGAPSQLFYLDTNVEPELLSS